MNKKILVGSMLVLTLLLLMPTIPAIQNKVVKDEIKEKILSEIPDDINLRELLEDIKSDYWKHPILNLLVLITALRAFRGFFIMFFSLSNMWVPGEDPEVEHHLFFIRGVWLLATGAGLNSLLYIFAKNMGWEFNSILFDILKNLGWDWDFGLDG